MRIQDEHVNVPTITARPREGQGGVDFPPQASQSNATITAARLILVFGEALGKVPWPHLL